MLVLGSATPRPESWQRLPRATLPARVGRRPAARRGRRPAPRRPLSALAAAAHRPHAPGRRGRPRDPAAQPARRGARAALPQLRRGLPLRALRRQPRAARGRPPALPPLRLHPARAERVPASAARSSWPAWARARSASARPSASCCRTSRCCASTPTRSSGAARSTRRWSASRASRPPCSWARRWSPRATTSAICAWRRRSTPTRAWPGPTSAARSARSRCSRSWRAAAAAAAIPGSVVFQAWDPDQRVVRLAAEHAVEAFLAGELERRERLGYPPFRHLVRVEVAAAAAGRRDGRARRRCAPRPSRRCRATRCSGPRRSSACAGASAPSCSSRRCGPARAGSLLAELVARQGRALRRAERERRGRRRPAVRCSRDGGHRARARPRSRARS